MVMAQAKCIPLSEIDFYKLKSIPSGTWAKNSLYLIEEDGKTASLYATDKLGKPRTVAYNGQGIAGNPQETVMAYQVDVDSAGYYYYGYQYETYWRIIRVDKMDLTNSSIATAVSVSTFLGNWAVRDTLTYY